jgi:hypothetical protein
LCMYQVPGSRVVEIFAKAEVRQDGTSMTSPTASRCPFFMCEADVKRYCRRTD